MDVTYSRCAGLNVHKKTMVACVITPKAKITRTFSTMTGGLLEMADWLVEQQITHFATQIPSSTITTRPVAQKDQRLDPVGGVGRREANGYRSPPQPDGAVMKPMEGRGRGLTTISHLPQIPP